MYCLLSSSREHDIRETRYYSKQQCIKGDDFKDHHWSGGMAIVTDLKILARRHNITLKSQEDIASEAAEIVMRHHHSATELKRNFDAIISESEEETYRVYKKYEQEYVSAVIRAFIDHLTEEGEIRTMSDVPIALGKHVPLLDKFFLSLSQGRKARAGSAFETIHTSLFKQLGYPFSEQETIDGKPDFIMPSVEYYRRNAMACLIFTAKRTLRERWRQIVTEGTRGYGFFLATIDKKLSSNQLAEMATHRIYVVVPKNIKNENYSDKENVLSFEDFFTDHLDPRMTVWRRNGVI